MKAIFLTLIIFYVFHVGSLGQTVPKRANVINIELADSSSITSVTRLLVEYGYGIQHLDRQAGVITTTPKSVKRAGEVRLIISIGSGKAIIRGSYKGVAVTLNNVTDDSWSEIDYRGIEGSPTMSAWNEMMRIAKAIGPNITFAQK